MVDVKSPCHPSRNLTFVDGHTYLLGEKNPKKKEISGVGLCPECNQFVAFQYRK